METPKEILNAWKNFLLFNLSYFSVPFLLRTFFSPWRKYQWSYGRGFDVKRYLEAAVSNLFSRAVGAAMRSFLIITGLLTEILIIFAGIIAFFGWLFLPAVLIGGLIFGFNLIF